MEVIDATATPPIVMVVAALKLTPLIVIEEPGHPLAGEILDIENTGTTKVILT